MFQKLLAFTKKVADLSDRPALNPVELKAHFDAPADEVRLALNSLIDALKKTTAGDSGAKNIGATSIDGLVGNDVQTLLENLFSWVKNTGLGGGANNAVDWNNISKSGFYMGNTNGPFSGGGMVTGVHIQHTSQDYATQIVQRQGRTFTRNKEAGVWEPWVELSPIEPSFVEAERTVAQAIGVGETFKVINFTEYRDLLSEFTHATGEFKPKYSGTYLFTGNPRWSGTAPNANWYVDARINGQQTTPAARICQGAHATTLEDVGSVLLRLSTSDVVSFHIWHGDSVSKTLERFRLRVARVDR